MGIPLTGLSLSASMGVIHRIHGHPAHIRAPPFPPSPTRFADGYISMVKIADLPHRGHAGPEDPAHLA
jgi:hypothetical protein